MSVRSGVGAQLGVGVETTWGEDVTPTVFTPFTSEGLEFDPEYIESRSLRPDVLAQQDDLHVQSTGSASGPITFDFLTKGMLPYLNMLNGDVAAARTPAGATLAREWEFPVGVTGPAGKGLTIQVGRPDVETGTKHPFTHVGCKIVDLTFAFERGGNLTVTMSIDGKDQIVSRPLARAVYARGAVPYNFTRTEAVFDGVVVADCIRSGNVRISFPLDVGRQCLGTNGRKKEQHLIDHIAVEAALVAEFASLAHYNAMKDATRRRLAIGFTGPEIEAGHSFALDLVLAKTVTVRSPAPVEGPGIIVQNLTLRAVSDGTDPLLLIRQVTTDTRLA